MDTDIKQPENDHSHSFTKKYDSLMWLGLAIFAILIGVVTFLLPFVFIIAGLAVVVCVGMSFYTAIRERQLFLLLLSVGFAALLLYGLCTVRQIVTSGSD